MFEPLLARDQPRRPGSSGPTLPAISGDASRAGERAKPRRLEPPWALTPPYFRDDPSLYREGWENHETHRNRVRKRKTKVLLDALEGIETSGYERRCLGWVACWEVHVVATIAALLRRSYLAGYTAGCERNCNDNCNDVDREQAS